MYNLQQKGWVLQMKSKYAVIIVSVIIAVAIACYVGFWLQVHQNFKDSFGVELPYFMTDGERSLLQPFVSKELQGMNKAISAAKNTECDDASCMQANLKKFQDASQALDNAQTAAQHFDFDTTVTLVPVPEKTNP